MNRFGRALQAVALLASGFSSPAQDDVLLQAMRDEMTRSMDELQLPGMERPYFVSYLVREITEARVDATLGGISTHGESSRRSLSVEVRIGDRNIDNSNFVSASRLSREQFRALFPASLPLEDDYWAIRRSIWLATDGAYKTALAQLAGKRALLRNESRIEEVPDFSEEGIHRFADADVPDEIDSASLDALVRELAAVLRGHPVAFVSEVHGTARNEKVTYLNSEGSRFTRYEPTVSVGVRALTQSEDGTVLEDAIGAYADAVDTLPATDVLVRRVERLAERLRALSDAPDLRRYTGPVLFEGQAAAELVRQVLVPRLVAAKMPLMDDPRLERTFQQSSNPFMDRLGSRVLPRFLSIVDDPSASRLDDVPLLGGIEIDDEGVPARRTALVERGYLKTLLSDRNPVVGIPGSSGSRRGAGPAPSNLFVESSRGLSAEEMREELLALARDRELEFAIRIERISDGRRSLLRGGRPPQGRAGQGESSTLAAVEGYKVFQDGSEELIRQVMLLGIAESSFRDIVAASEARTVLTSEFVSRGVRFGPSRGRDPTLLSLVVPSLLFEDVAVRRPSGNVPRPPVSEYPPATE